MANKNSFVFYTEWLEQFKLIALCGDAADMSALCNSIKALVEGEEMPETTTPLAQMAFLPMRNQIERDTEKWNQTAIARSEAGKKGAEAKASKAKQSQANVSKAKQTSANQAVYVDVDVDEYVDDDVDVDVSPDGDNNLSVIALPAPQFVAETDPKKLTDKTLEEEFDALWMLYPRKQGKSDALRHYKSARKNGTTFDEVEEGINRYRQHILEEHTEDKYIAHGSTWFCGHRWEDHYSRHGPKAGSMEWLAQIANGGVT